MKEPTERDLQELASQLARNGRISAPARLRTQLRASLLAAPVTPAHRAVFGWLNRSALRPVVAIGLVLALLAAGGGSAAASSLPGDPAFGLKRAVEEVQVALAPNDAARLDALVTQSDRRLSDLETAVTARPSATGPATDEYRAAIGRVDATLAKLLTQPATPARDAAVTRASVASADHISTLQVLAARLPVAAQQGIGRAIEAQQAIHGRSGSAPGRSSPPEQVPGRGGTPGGLPASAVPGRPSGLPNGAPPVRGGGPPSGVPANR